MDDGSWTSSQEASAGRVSFVLAEVEMNIRWRTRRHRDPLGENGNQR
jgi:hypothetical protein